jgi:hypothetical protein
MTLNSPTDGTYLARALQQQTISIRGARTHNLKNIDLDIRLSTASVNNSKAVPLLMPEVTGMGIILSTRCASVYITELNHFCLRIFLEVPIPVTYSFACPQIPNLCLIHVSHWTVVPPFECKALASTSAL